MVGWYKPSSMAAMIPAIARSILASALRSASAWARRAWFWRFISSW
jgi:hypothetical protein